MFGHIMAAIADKIEDNVSNIKAKQRGSGSNLWHTIQDLLLDLQQQANDSWINQSDTIETIIDDLYYNSLQEDAEIHFEYDDTNCWIEAYLYYKQTFATKISVQYHSMQRINETIQNNLERINNTDVRNTILDCEALVNTQAELESELPYTVSYDHNFVYYLYSHNGTTTDTVRIPTVQIPVSRDKLEEYLINGISALSILKYNTPIVRHYFTKGKFKTRYKLTLIDFENETKYVESIDDTIINILDENHKYITEDNPDYFDIQDIFYDKIDNISDWKKVKIYDEGCNYLSEHYNPRKENEVSNYHFRD